MDNEFKAITTQEEFDAAIKSRLDRCKATTAEEVTKRFEGYISPEELQKKNGETEKQINSLKAELGKKDGSIADLTAKVKGYETHSVKMRIAHENGIPYELADKLSGETEEDIIKDAQTFSKFISHSTNGKPAPLASSDVQSSGKDNNLKTGLLKTLAKMEGE